MKILVIEDQLAPLKRPHHVLKAAGQDVSDAAPGEPAFAAVVADCLQLLRDAYFLKQTSTTTSNLRTEKRIYKNRHC